MYYDDPVAPSVRAWRALPGPRLLVIEAEASVDARRRLPGIVGGIVGGVPGGAPDDASGHDQPPIAWVRPPPGGGPPLSTAVPGESHPIWDDVWQEIREQAGTRAGGIWLVDDAHRLTGPAWSGLLGVWGGIRGQALPVHLILVGPVGLSERLGDVPHERIALPPLSSADWLSVDATWSPVDRVRAAAILGRSAVLRAAVDPSRSVGRNARSLLLAPNAPHATRALDAVRTSVQRPERYLRVVRALAEGRREWGDVRDAVGGMSASGQLGPYMKTLEELGLVVGDRSLDAGPRSRSRRWRVAEPHVAFWFSCILPGWDRLGVDDPRRLWSEIVEPRLDAHVGRTLPRLLAEWLESPASTGLFGSGARETGGLWGEGYDIDVAATLRNGAIVYAWTRWAGGPANRGSFTSDEVEARLEEVRATRWGFGRERRLKLFVQRDPPDHDLARLDARAPELVIVDVARLVGPVPRAG